MTAQKPILGLAVTIAAGFTNIFLDFLFVGIFQWGIAGAGIATAVSQIVGGLFPLAYFFCPNTSLLRLTRPARDLHLLIKTCTNGSSELMSSVSASVVSILYNLQLMRFTGENGVAAYGVLMYVSMIFQGIFMGYSVGAAPVIGYHYGAENHVELKNLRRKSLLLTGIFSAAMFLAGQALARPLSIMFVGYDPALLDMTVHAFVIYSFSFLLSGFGIFGSSFFTALNDGFTSSLISLLRTLVFQCSMVMILPLLWGLDGIWLSIVAAEALAVTATAAFLWGLRKKYRY